MLCYVAAYLSWNLLEKPFLALKRFFVPTVRGIPAPQSVH